MSRPWDPDPDDYLIDDKPMVCIAHLCFVPCRHEVEGDPCRHSTDPEDVEKTRQFQQGDHK